jgi:hypothetical protein
MNILAVPYANDHTQAVSLGSTLRILVKSPEDGNTWSGNVAIQTLRSAAATDDFALGSYTGGKFRGQSWDLVKDYDTSSLAANTKYLITAELTYGSKVVEYNTTVHILPDGR